MTPMPNYARRVAALTAVAALAFVALQCIEAPLQPILPMYEVQLSIPVANFVRTMEDMFTKDTSTVKRDAAGYYYQDTQAGQPTKLDTLKVQPKPSGNQVTVGK